MVGFIGGYVLFIRVMSRAYRLATASKEDIEYFECQDEMAADLLEQHKQVERVIGRVTLKS